MHGYATIVLASAVLPDGEAVDTLTETTNLSADLIAIDGFMRILGVIC